MTTEVYYTIPELCRHLMFGEKIVRQMRSDPDFPKPIRQGRALTYDVRAVDAWMMRTWDAPLLLPK